MDIKTLDKIQDKFVRRTSQAGPDYEAGVSAPKRDWAQATKAAEANFEQGIQAAIGRKSFGKGVTKAGSAKFLRGAKEKGVARYPSGVAAGAADYAQGFAPFHSALAAATLPPRKARRDPSNLARVNAVVQVMIKTAEAKGG